MLALICHKPLKTLTRLSVSMFLDKGTDTELLMGRRLLPPLGICLAACLWTANTVAAQIVDPTTALPETMARWREAAWGQPYRLPMGELRWRLLELTGGEFEDYRSATSGGASRPPATWQLGVSDRLPGLPLQAEPMRASGLTLRALDLTPAPVPVPVPAAFWLFSSGVVALMSMPRRRRAHHTSAPDLFHRA